jgi:hypothetical protein
MAAACDGDECDPPPAAKDLAGREQQPRGPVPEAQLPVALPPRTAGRAATLNRSPASPQPSTPARARTQRRPTSRTRAGRNKHEDVGAAVARAGRTRPNETPKLNSEASKPSRLSNSRQEPSDSACPTLLRSAAVPGSVAPGAVSCNALLGIGWSNLRLRSGSGEPSPPLARERARALARAPTSPRGTAELPATQPAQATERRSSVNHL